MNAKTMQNSIKMPVVIQQKELQPNVQPDKANEMNSLQNHTL